MQITVACHQCDHPKRPLSACPSCHAAPLAEPELQAWRMSLHARHLARIEATPVADQPAQRAPGEQAPMTAVLLLDGALDHVLAVEPTLLPFIPFDPGPLPDAALEFDWDDEPRNDLRRSA